MKRASWLILFGLSLVFLLANLVGCDAPGVAASAAAANGDRVEAVDVVVVPPAAADGISLAADMSADSFAAVSTHTRRCDAETCPDGCCNADGQCETSANKSCGRHGVECVACVFGTQCIWGQCEKFCNSDDCKTGCCNGTTCEKGDTVALCGAAGNVCEACAAGQACVNGACVSAGDDDDNDDDNDNDDNDDNDNDDNDDNDNDDDASPADIVAPSMRFGVVDFVYYYDLGGYTGAVFYADAEWVAKTVQLGIIGTTPDGTLQNWEQIASDKPVGTWLNWRPPQVYYTYEATGTCSAPTVGAQYPDWTTDTADFNGFLAAYPEYGDGETCFLHAQNDGQIQATWQTMGCSVTLNQAGLDGSANGNMTAARLVTIIWDGYAWLFDMNSACAQQYTAWRTVQDIQTLGFTGEGFDNLGSPPEDGYSIPVLMTPIDIMEMTAAEQATQAAIDTYWQNAVHSFLVGVRAKTVAVEPNAAFMFNGASYCSWDGSNARIAELATEGVGVWCEEALTYPVWGPFGTSDREQTMITLSQALNAEGSYLALETFYNSGNTNPDPPETMFYLAAYYNFKSGTDAFIVRPTWSTYSPMETSTWSDIFSRDIGSPTCDSTAGANGIFTRSYQNSDGMQTFVLVRADGTNATVDYTLTKDYCSVNSDNSLTAMPAGTISVPSGLGLILIVNGTGGVSC